MKRLFGASRQADQRRLLRAGHRHLLDHGELTGFAVHAEDIDVLGASVRYVDECFVAISSHRPLRSDPGKDAERGDPAEPELQYAASSHDVLLPLQFTRRPALGTTSVAIQD